MTTLEQTSQGSFAIPAALTTPSLGVRLRQPWFPGWRRLVGTAGPGLLIAVGYIDPGNWATDLGGGSRYGYALLSMVFIANLIAMVVQALCVRLAIATGKSLAEYSRETYSRPVVLMLWLSAEIAMVMTDLAELVGGAIALKLLFGIGLVPGVLLTERRHARLPGDRARRLALAARPGLRPGAGRRRKLRFPAVACPAGLVGGRRGLLPTPQLVSRPGHAAARPRHHRRDRDAA